MAKWKDNSVTKDQVVRFIAVVFFEELKLGELNSLTPKTKKTTLARLDDQKRLLAIKNKLLLLSSFHWASPSGTTFQEELRVLEHFKVDRATMTH